MRESWDTASCGSTKAPGASCPAIDPLREFLDVAEVAGKPFFVWFAPKLPHSPFDAPPEYVAPVRSTGLTASVAYFANVRWADEVTGELLEELAARGIRENTLVVYVSDNGWGAAGLQPSAGAGRGKGTSYALGSRSPILFSLPGTIEPADLPDLVSTSDIPATILGFAGVQDVRPIPEQVGLDLRDRLMGGPPIPRTEIVQHEPRPTVLQWLWRYLVNVESEAEELYRLDLDPLEWNDLARDEPERVAAMRARAAAHLADLLEPPARTELLGRVTDPDTGAPVVGAQVRVSADEVVSTDSGGWFLLGSLSGRKNLRAHRGLRELAFPKTPRITFPFSLGSLFLPLEGKGGAAPIEASAGRLAGQVVDLRTGAPISGAKVRLKGRSPASTPRMLTGDDGRGHFEGLASAEYAVQVRAVGYRTSTARGIPSGQLDLSFELEPRS